MEWIVQLPILLFSVVVHEAAHGWTAYAHGDDTAERAGRLTLNPLPHLDPFGSVLLPMFCFVAGMPMLGWAVPVPVDPRRMKPRGRGMLAVALAGPGANLALALAAAVAFKASEYAVFLGPGFHLTLRNALFFAVAANALLASFNLLPVPPLDGSRVVGGLIPAAWRPGWERLAPYGAVVLLALVATNLIGPLVAAPARAALEVLRMAGLL